MYNTNRKNTPVYGTVCLIVQKRNQKETKERIYMSCIHPMVHLVQKMRERKCFKENINDNW